MTGLFDAGSGRRASVTPVSILLTPKETRGDAILAGLNVPRPRAVIVLNGGTEDIDSEIAPALRRALQEGLARVVIDDAITVVSGGTDAGVFALFGEGLDRRATAPCIGVAPAARVESPQRPAPAHTPRAGQPVPLEPHHTHFVLVDAEQWGDETQTMLSLVDALAREAPSVAVLAGGGAIAKREVLEHVRRGREVIVLAGSGRFADQLADVVNGRAVAEDSETAEIGRGRLTVFDIRRPPTELAALVRSRLVPQRRRRTLRSVLPALAPLPRLRWRPASAEPFVPPAALAASPALAPDIELLERELVPLFRKLDEDSLHAQNTYRLGQLAVIVGGMVASTLGAAQTALGGGVIALAVPEAIIAGLLASVLVYVRGRNAQREYFTRRLKAERLRSEYFLFLSRVGDYAEKDNDTRRRLLHRRTREVALGREET
jgi:hypothetical protein